LEDGLSAAGDHSGGAKQLFKRIKRGFHFFLPAFIAQYRKCFFRDPLGVCFSHDQLRYDFFPQE
jgi:hypothetical protein